MVRRVPHHHVHHPLRPHVTQRPRRGHPGIVPGAEELVRRQDVLVSLAEPELFFVAEEAFDLLVPMP